MEVDLYLVFFEGLDIVFVFVFCVFNIFYCCFVLVKFFFRGRE